MSFFENTRKPVGFGGKIMVAMMNLGHSPVAQWGLHFLELAPDARVLDCGCGGGANIKSAARGGRAAWNISSLQRIGLMRLPRLKRSTSGRICRSVSGRFGGC